MRFLFLTKYSRKGASSRLRSFQYFPLLESKGVEVVSKPLFDDQYLSDLYSGKTSFFHIVRLYLQRIVNIFSIYKYDKVVIEKELLPYFPPIFEYFINKLGYSYIVDYDDAIFHNYDRHNKKIVKFFLGNKIDIVMKNSATVVAGNSYLAQRAINAKAKDVQIIPTVVNLERYRTSSYVRKNKKIIIGWIGSPSTFRYVESLKSVFVQLEKNYNLEIQIIGAHQTLGLPGIEKTISWSEETEVDSLLNFDIGIMPLEDSPWEKGKCAYKIIQYMACGLPVVASPVGMNSEVVDHGSTGFLARNEEEWRHFLEIYIKNDLLRKEHGLKGLEVVKTTYSISAVQNKFLKNFKLLN